MNIILSPPLNPIQTYYIHILWLSNIFKFSSLNSTRSRLRDFFVKTVVEKFNPLVVIFEELLPSELSGILGTIDLGSGGWYWDQGVIRLLPLLVLHWNVLLNIWQLLETLRTLINLAWIDSRVATNISVANRECTVQNLQSNVQPVKLLLYSKVISIGYYNLIWL